MSNLCQKFTYNNFSVNTSMNENILYIYIVNNDTCKIYENNIDMNASERPYNNNDTYNIICKCLESKTNSEFIIKMEKIKFTFSEYDNGCYEFYHYIYIPEKKIVNNISHITNNISQLGVILYKVYYNEKNNLRIQLYEKLRLEERMKLYDKMKFIK